MLQLVDGSSAKLPNCGKISQKSQILTHIGNGVLGRMLTAYGIVRSLRYMEQTRSKDPTCAIVKHMGNVHRLNASCDENIDNVQ